MKKVFPPFLSQEVLLTVKTVTTYVYVDTVTTLITHYSHYWNYWPFSNVTLVILKKI